MSAPPPISPDLLDCVQRLAVVLHARIEILNAIIAAVVKEPSVPDIRAEKQVPESVARVLPLMIQALGSSCHTLIRLSDEPGLHTRDCYSIVRSIVELGINVCYIMANGDEAAERAMRHTRQKAYRDLERESQIGDNRIQLLYTGKPDPATIDGLEEELAEFETKSGQEKQQWVDANVDKRIESVGIVLGEPVLSDLHFARFAVYRHSSEVLHGTHFGVHHCFGLTLPREKNDPLNRMGDNHMVILMAANLTISAVANAFHKSYGFPVAEKHSLDLWNATGEIPYFRRGAEAARGDASADQT